MSGAVDGHSAARCRNTIVPCAKTTLFYRSHPAWAAARRARARAGRAPHGMSCPQATTLAMPR
eukprot:2707229-Prymnesium_polylepis.1